MLSSCREFEKDTRAPGGKPKFSKTKFGILLINSLCGTKANGPFSAKSWPGGFLEPRHLHLLLRCLQKAHRSSRLRGFRVRTFAVTAAPPKGPFWQLWRPPKAFSRGERCFPPSCSLQGAHKTSRLRGFRVRTCAVTAAPPKQPFWQLWRLPKPFSRGETWLPPRCSLQEARRSSKLRGFRVRTSAVTAAPPKRPFWQLWRSPKAFSRGETCFPPSCSLQGAHKSSRLRGFRVRTLAVTAAPPKRPFWQLWRPPKAFSRGETCFPPSCSLQGAHKSSRLRGFRVRTLAVTAAPPKRPFWQLWRPPKAFSRGETSFPPSCNLQEAHRSSRLRGFRVRTLAVTAAPPKRPFWQLWRPPKAFLRGETCFPDASGSKESAPRGPRP